MISNAQLTSLYAAVDEPEPEKPLPPSVWAARRERRRRLGRIAWDCMDEGYKPMNGLHWRVGNRYRKEVGLGLMELLTIFGVIAQIVRIVIDLRRGRSAVAVLLVALLCCLPTSASELDDLINTRIDQRIETKLVPEKKLLDDRLSLLERYIERERRFEIVHVPAEGIEDYGAWVNDKIAEIQTRNPGRWAIAFMHPSGAEYRSKSKVVLGRTVAGSHLLFTSPGHRQCCIVKQGDGHRKDSILFDLFDADECEISNLVLTEQSGYRNCALVRSGGTTNKLHNNWISAAKYGVIGAGAGFDITNCTIENCDVLVELNSRYWNPALGISRGVNNLQHAKLTNNVMYSGSLRFVNYMQVQLNVDFGAVSAGDTIASKGVECEIHVSEDESDGSTWILLTHYQGKGLSVGADFKTSGGASGTIEAKKNNRCQRVIISDLEGVTDTALPPYTRNAPYLFVSGVHCFDTSNVDFWDGGWVHCEGTKNLRLSGTCVMAADVAANHPAGTTIRDCWGFWDGGWADAYAVDIDDKKTMLGDYLENRTDLR